MDANYRADPVERTRPNGRAVAQELRPFWRGVTAASSVVTVLRA